MNNGNPLKFLGNVMKSLYFPMMQIPKFSSESGSYIYLRARDIFGPSGHHECKRVTNLWVHLVMDGSGIRTWKYNETLY